MSEGCMNCGGGELGYGSQPVGGPGTSAAKEPTKNIQEMADEFTERCQTVLDHEKDVTEQNLRDELCRTICLAEEQGYRIGFDTATESSRVFRDEREKVIDAQHQDIAQLQKTMDFARRSIREMHDEAKQKSDYMRKLERQVAELQAALKSALATGQVALVYRRKETLFGQEVLEMLRVEEVTPTAHGLVVYVR